MSQLELEQDGSESWPGPGTAGRSGLRAQQEHQIGSAVIRQQAEAGLYDLASCMVCTRLVASIVQVPLSPKQRTGALVPQAENLYLFYGTSLYVRRL